MATRPKINVTEIVEGSKVEPLHVMIALLCGGCLMVDGFDIQAMGYTAPALIRDWGIAGLPALGPVFSAAIVGILFGSLMFSTVADKVGRRPMLITATLFFSVMTFATAFTRTINELLLVRFIAGVGLGGIMPNALALIGEYMPTKKRAAAMLIVGNGLNLGAALGGFMAAWLIPNFGWRSVFIFGGVVPLVMGILMIIFLPESLQLMVLRGQDRRKIVKNLKRINPAANIDENTEFIVNEEKKEGVPVIHLFSGGRGLITILLWVVFFLNLLNLFLLSSWLPTLVSQLGYAPSTAVLVGTMLQAGGTIGGFAVAGIIGKLRLVPTLSIGFLIAAICIALIGQVGATVGLMFLVVFLAGWGILGGQNLLNTLAGSYYPTYLRSTGMGWCLGIGRLGAIIGPLLAGELIRRNVPQSQLFMVAGSLALTATVVILTIGARMKPTKTESVPPKEVLAH